MNNNDGQKHQTPVRWHADVSVWFIWLGLFFLAVAILPFTVRNSDIVRQIAVMCGFAI